MDLAKYGKHQLEGSQDQRICVRSSKQEMRKEKTITWTHFERRESLVKEVFKKRMEEKREGGTPRIMLLDDIKTKET